MPLVDDNSKIHPIFCNCFAERQMFHEKPDDFLKIINAYYAKINGEEYLPFESELKLLFIQIENFNNDDPILMNKINLFKCLIKFYTGEEDVSSELYDQILPDRFEQSDIYDNIYNIIGKVYTKKPSTDLPNSRIVISGGFKHDLLHFQRHYLKQLRYSNMKVESSQNLPDVSAIFQDCNHIFFVGHGNENEGEGFNYYYDYIDAFRLRADTLEMLSKEVEVLALLSCASEPYADIHRIAKYFILPDTAFSEYAEMFIKGFYRKWEEFGDIDLNIQLGLIALLLRSNKTLVFNVYKDGLPFKI